MPKASEVAAELRRTLRANESRLEGISKLNPTVLNSVYAAITEVLEENNIALRLAIGALEPARTSSGMTQRDALTKLQSLVGAKARVEHDHTIGWKHGNMDDFYLWDGADLLASSSVCWEQAFAELEAKLALSAANDDSRFQPNSDFEAEEAQIGGAA